MTLSHWATATLTALLGSQPLPGLSGWTPATFYSACQLYLKTLILGGPGLFVIDAPFGRFSLSNSAFKLPGRLAFSLMELPAPVFFALALASPNQLSNEAVDGGATFFGTLLQPSMSHLQTLPVANLILASLYVGHYTHRAVLQPLMGPARSPSHISVFLSAFVCQTANGFTMGSWLGGRSPALLIPAGLLSVTEALSKSARPLKSVGWFAGILPRSKAATTIASSVLPLAKPGLLPPGPSTVSHPLFLIGVAGWAIFFLANVYHDEILLNLRRPAKRGDGPAQGTRANAHKDESKPEAGAQPRYEVPTGGLYSFISFPNYLCEWLEWSFFALAALSQSPLSPLSAEGLPLTNLGRWSLLLSTPPAVFVLMEVSVMLPRAVKGHQWYRSKFGVQGDGKGGRYPKDRKAIIPYLL